MVVLAVVGIFTTMVLPKLRFALAAYDLERTSRRFAADLQVAQTEAWRRNRSVTVTRVSATQYRAELTSNSLVLFQRTLDGGSTFTTTWNPVRLRSFGPPVFTSPDVSLTVAVQNVVGSATLTRTIRVAQGGAVTVGP